MKEFFEKIKFYIVIFGIIGLIMGVINVINGKSELAKTGFIFFGVAVVVVMLTFASSKINDRKPPIKTQSQIPADLKKDEPVIVLGMVVLLENPLRSEADKSALIQSIFDQQTKEFKRVVASTAKVQITVAGTSLDDEAYVYSMCRSAFDGLDSYANNDEFLQRVATGSFQASDGNRGKHYAFLNRKIT
jgi:hypothetical protein